MASSLRSLLVHATVNDLISLRAAATGVPHGHVLTTRDDSTVDAALLSLSTAKVLSSPMINGDGDATGFCDIRDILLSFLEFLEPLMESMKSMKMLELLTLLEERGVAFGKTRLCDLPSGGLDGQFIYHKQQKGSLLELIFFSLGLKGGKDSDEEGKASNTRISHRFGFFDQEGKITQIISQSDFIAFLATRISELGPLSSESILSLNLANQAVECVEPQTSAIRAMQMMKDKGVSSLGVVNHEGKLIGNFSASDFRSLQSEHFGSLALPLAEFLALSHRTEFVWHSEHPTSDAAHKFATDPIRRGRPHVAGEEVGQALILVAPSETFGSLIVKFATNRVHRVYIVDEDEKPVGIVTLTDVLIKVADLCVSA